MTPTDEGLTLVRTRGLLRLQLQSVDAAGSGFEGACGLQIVTAEAFAIGVTAMPSPQTDPEWEGWIWHSFFSLRPGSALSGLAGITEFEIDSKAMRKLPEGAVMMGVVEVVETGAAVMLFYLDTRILVKLS